jgi:signal transduction histidine kinase
LDIKRLEAGQPITNLKEFYIHDLIEDAKDAVKPVISSKRQKLHIQIEDNIPTIIADEGMLRRVLINLLENAIKFTPLDGDIFIGSRQENNELLLWVADSGPGIPDEAKNRIFNKFTRLQAKQFPKGIGLGLAFCKLAVNAHNGKIWVESSQESGSCFNVLLPFEQK